MKEILSEISILSIKNADVPYTVDQINSNWIGFAPSTPGKIDLLERSLGTLLPQDYKDFLLLTNGFSAVNYSTEPSFAPMEEVDYLINLDKELIDIWLEHGVPETGEILSKSILIGGFREEQHFLLIPPTADHQKWRYWKFASWIPGEQAFENLNAYFLDVLDFLIKES
ncbi:SMI1/KNR4 family protein [Pedobacter sp. AW31-3R]|uniref:SMI1/KNR4 family protein n=1 Tax=Pedobacter sp. AW31-3R TaxID=3445781 RepID=UPI003F9FA6BD